MHQKIKLSDSLYITDIVTIANFQCMTLDTLYTPSIETRIILNNTIISNLMNFLNSLDDFVELSPKLLLEHRNSSFIFVDNSATIILSSFEMKKMIDHFKTIDRLTNIMKVEIPWAKHPVIATHT